MLSIPSTEVVAQASLPSCRSPHRAARPLRGSSSPNRSAMWLLWMAVAAVFLPRVFPDQKLHYQKVIVGAVANAEATLCVNVWPYEVDNYSVFAHK